MDRKRGRRIVLGSVALGALLLGIDLGRAASDPASFPWAWLALGTSVWIAIVLAAACLLGDRGARWLRPAPCVPASPAGTRPAWRTPIWVGILTLGFAAAAGTLLVASGIGAHGDEVRQLGGAVDTHALITRSGAVSLPIEISPYWAAAGLIGRGGRMDTLLAGRLVSLASVAALVAIVAWASGRKAGTAGALVGGLALALSPTAVFSSIRLTEDALLMLLFSSGWILLVLSADRPRLWPLAGLIAGMAGAVKGTGLLLVPVIPVALVAEGRVDRRSWPWLAIAIACAALPLLPAAVLVAQGTCAIKGSDLLGLLPLHGPEALRAASSSSIPEFPGWGASILARAGILTVGDIAAGIAMSMKPPQLWILLVLAIAALRRRYAGAHAAALLAVVLPALGMLAWKGGDAARPFYLLGAPAALVLGVHAREAAAALKRSPSFLLVAALLAGASIVGLVWQVIALVGRSP